MQVWSLHNPVRYALVFADGPAMLFDYKGAEHHSKHLKAIDEAKPATAWIYVMAGDKAAEQAVKWAAEIGDLHRARFGDLHIVTINQHDRNIGTDDQGGNPLEH